MSLSFSKQFRLRKKTDFLRVLKVKNRHVGNYLNIDFFFNPTGANQKLGITVTKKYGSSPERNLFKRRLRELFRHIKNELPSNLEIVVYPNTKAPSLQNIRDDFLAFRQKIIKK